MISCTSVYAFHWYAKPWWIEVLARMRTGVMLLRVRGSMTAASFTIQVHLCWPVRFTKRCLSPLRWRDKDVTQEAFFLGGGGLLTNALLGSSKRGQNSLAMNTFKGSGM